MQGLLENFALYVIPFLFVIMIVVTVHELGHFLVARAFGVAVDRFSIGFGRALVSWRDRTGVEWRIAWLPVGGYVKFAGDENAASVPTMQDLESLRATIVARDGPGSERRYLQFKPLWQRSLIILAGPVANFLLAIALFAVCIGMFGQTVISTKVVKVDPGSAAAAAGFQPGDRVTSADGHMMRSFQDLATYVQVRAGLPIDFEVERSGRVIHMVAEPRAHEQGSPFGGSQTVGLLGLRASGFVVRHYGPLEAVSLGAFKTWDVAATTAFYLGRLVTGQVSPDQLHSFIGMGYASGTITRLAVAEAKETGGGLPASLSGYLFQLIGLISVSVGLLNLLPIPVLDGGHLLFHAYEWVARKPPGLQLQAAGYRVGLALLVGLMLFATWNDLQRLRVFHFFGS